MRNITLSNCVHLKMHALKFCVLKKFGKQTRERVRTLAASLEQPIIHEGIIHGGVQ